MRRILGVGLGFLLLVASPTWGGIERVDLPWKTFTELVSDAQGSMIGACRTSETTEVDVLAVQLTKGNDAYMYWYEFASGRIVWVVYVGNVDGATPDAVGTGTVDLKTPGAHDIIPTIKWELYDKDKHITPCDFLVGPKKSGA